MGQHVGRGGCCQVVPPYLLERLVRNGDAAERQGAAQALQTSEAVRALRARRATAPAAGRGTRRRQVVATALRRTIHDAEHREELGGPVVRDEGDDASGDVAADEAYDGLGATHRFLDEALGRSSIDDAGMALVGHVHFGRDYDNAFWDGENMVFGDGDGATFNRFTVAVDVIAHELAHGIIEIEARLDYRDQPGALNESVADVFGAMVKQHARGQSAAEADWLVGQGLFTEAVDGMALRSMAAPGTAYDDEKLGKDPQPAHMDDFVRTRADNGGVHINSGIPNKAFHLLATDLGGASWERAGVIWYEALRSPSLRRTAGFLAFARVTHAVAAERFDGEVAGAVADAWRQVGITVAT